MMSTLEMPKPKRLKPAELVAARAGGIRPLARMLDIDPSSISKWIDRGGHIPAGRVTKDTHQRLLKTFKEKGLKLTAEELVLGGYE